MRAVVLLAVLAIISVCEGAVLVRFVNTVPTRTTPTTYGYSATGHLTGDVPMDRIGLQYSSTGQAPALVWTEATNPRSDDVSGGLSPYAYIHAMPPLRQYHRVDTAGTTALLVDTVATYKTTDLAAGCTNVASCDNFDQSTLKGDGVGLYLQFAAGTYTLQAYAIVSTGAVSEDRKAVSRAITGSSRSITLEDGKVYSIIATGNGAFSATPALTGNTVTLTLIEESVAPTTFGMAALRWFHAIRSQSANTISIYQTSTTNNAIASDIAFASVSNYIDVAPNSQANFPVTASGSVTTVITGTNVASTHDIRAGLRATIVCAQMDETTATVFCRMIPSRVVAYVRLVNDLAGQTNQVQGVFGGQALNLVKLTLWGSYELPRPSQVVEGSQVLGMSTVPRIATLARGLYGVVSSVAAGSCSGYGEVFVPVPIMDYAVRFIIVKDSSDAPNFVNNAYAGDVTTVGTADLAYTANPNTVSPIAKEATWGWFVGAPVHKRVNFIVKTDGFATLSGLAFAAAGANPSRDITNVRWLNNALLLDTYMEPGQYYTLMVTSDIAGIATPFVAYNIQTADVKSVRFYWRLDRTIDGVTSTSGLTASGKANLNWIYTPIQNFAGTINLRKKGTSNVALSQTITATAWTDTLAMVPATSPQTAWNTPAVGISADAGDYSFDHAATQTNVCINKIPNSNDITLAAGDIYDIFLLNTFGCTTGSNNANSLTVLSCKTQSALVTNNAVNTLLDGTAPAAPQGQMFTSSASVASSSLAFVAALIALVAALL
jgi:hypothetical protein